VKLSKERLDLWFTLTEGDKSIPIHYRGAVPDAFKEGMEVVVDGRMQDSGTFEGRELIVKCPSKYESGEPGPGAKGPAEKT
jgi:cytochrome c-type biogenesis protein CcmE